MAKKVLLLHGWGGSDFPHWQSWLAGEIAKEALLITSTNDPYLHVDEAKEVQSSPL